MEEAWESLKAYLMEENTIKAILLLFFFVWIPLDIFYIFTHRKSDHRVYEKNLFDWIIYILAWITVPVFFLAFSKKEKTGKNWEERRRRNLYALIENCIISVFLFATWVAILRLKAEDNYSSTNEKLVIGAYILVLLGVLLVVNFIVEHYEKHLENKSYIPGKTDRVALKLPKGKR